MSRSPVHRWHESDVTDAPLIGDCTAFEEATWGFWTQEAAIVPSTYVARIRAAGGIAVGLIPDDRTTSCSGALLERVDALPLVGGVDVDPSSYGAVRSPCPEATEPRRDVFEIALARAALQRDVPILGICRGMQVLNVASGGTLHQHLIDSGFQQHRPRPGRLDRSTFHGVKVTPSWLAASLAGPGTQVVNSHHHQGVDAIGAGAVVTARLVPDELPEAIEWPSHRYALGVQWHPESPDLQRAFDDLVAAAAASRKVH